MGKEQQKPPQPPPPPPIRNVKGGVEKNPKIDSLKGTVKKK